MIVLSNTELNKGILRLGDIAFVTMYTFRRRKKLRLGERNFCYLCSPYLEIQVNTGKVLDYCTLISPP